jgi:hypothetical protein
MNKGQLLLCLFAILAIIFATGYKPSRYWKLMKIGRDKYCKDYEGACYYHSNCQNRICKKTWEPERIPWKK